MTKEEALNIIRNVFLHEDNQLNNDGQIGAKDIHNALTIACAALCESSLPSDLEKEIQLYLAKLGFGDGDGWADGITINDLRDIARHFYKLGGTQNDKL